MKIRILTYEGSQEVEVSGSPIFVCIGDKKYILTERGSFRRIWSKLKKDLIEMVGERRNDNS